MSKNPAFYTAKGAKSAKKLAISDDVFNIEVATHGLLKQAYVAHQANARENFAVTKTRGEVSGGGKKPWKQKGTGRARFGSSRVPIWRGGGITFGPTGNENYSKKINVKAKRLAIRQALTLANTSGKLIAVEDYAGLDGKTKDFAAFLDKIGAKRRILVVLADKKEEPKAVRNLPDVKVVQASYLNVVDILNADTIVMCENSFAIVGEWLGEAK